MPLTVKTMADQNEKRKKAILDRAKRGGNRKVLALVEDEFLAKLDQAGPMAGIWLESLEHDFSALEKKPQGLMAKFNEKDFDALFKALYGYSR